MSNLPTIYCDTYYLSLDEYLRTVPWPQFNINFWRMSMDGRRIDMGILREYSRGSKKMSLLRRDVDGYGKRLGVADTERRILSFGVSEDCPSQVSVRVSSMHESPSFYHFAWPERHEYTQGY